jgi:hypothetical protein
MSCPRSRVALTFVQAAVAALFALGAGASQAVEVVVKLPDFHGDPSLPTHELVGTFNFGSVGTILGATISGAWGAPDQVFFGSADATLYANGSIAVATCTLGALCWGNGSAPVAWSYDFTGAQIATFASSGKLALYADADVCCTNVLSNLTLTLNVAAVPEPETYALMLAGGGVVAWLGRRRRVRGEASIA